MKFRRSSELTKAQERAAKIDSPQQLREYAESYLHAVGAGLREYDRNRGTDQLEFAVIDAEMLHALLQRLHNLLES